MVSSGIQALFGSIDRRVQTMDSIRSWGPGIRKWHCSRSPWFDPIAANQDAPASHRQTSPRESPKPSSHVRPAVTACGMLPLAMACPRLLSLAKIILHDAAHCRGPALCAN